VPRIRHVAISTALIVGIMMPGSPARACDGPFPWLCQTASTATDAEPQATDAQPPATDHPLLIKRHRSKHHVGRAARGRGTKHARHGSDSPRKARAATTMDRDAAIAEQRFREFVSPRSIATNVVEHLQLPRPAASQFRADTTYPIGAVSPRGQNAGGGIAPSPAEQYPPSLNNEQDVAVNDAPAAHGGDAIATVEPRLADDGIGTASQMVLLEKGISESSWIGIGFLAWGGLLAVGSVLRLFVG
jgi:hypothetical protein